MIPGIGFRIASATGRLRRRRRSGDNASSGYGFDRFRGLQIMLGNFGNHRYRAGDCRRCGFNGGRCFRDRSLAGGLIDRIQSQGKCEVWRGGRILRVRISIHSGSAALRKVIIRVDGKALCGGQIRN